MVVLTNFFFFLDFYGGIFEAKILCLYPHFLFSIPLNIKFGYRKKKKILPKIYNLFTVFSHIALAIYARVICNYL